MKLLKELDWVGVYEDFDITDKDYNKITDTGLFDDEEDGGYPVMVEVNDLRQEAIKWIKEFRVKDKYPIIDTVKFIKLFFGIDEKDIGDKE